MSEQTVSATEGSTLPRYRRAAAWSLLVLLFSVAAIVVGLLATACP